MRLHGGLSSLRDRLPVQAVNRMGSENEAEQSIGRPRTMKPRLDTNSSRPSSPRKHSPPERNLSGLSGSPSLDVLPSGGRSVHVLALPEELAVIYPHTVHDDADPSDRGRRELFHPLTDQRCERLFEAIRRTPLRYSPRINSWSRLVFFRYGGSTSGQKQRSAPPRYSSAVCPRVPSRCTRHERPTRKKTGSLPMGGASPLC